jgi:moderate conductance mechanosensitive channel
MAKIRFFLWAILGSIILTLLVHLPIQAQIPSLPNLNLPNGNWFTRNSETAIAANCIRLDGRCIFKVAHQRSDISDRVADIEERLENIKNNYVQSDRAALVVTQQKTGNLREIYVTVGDREIRLMTVTNLDAQLTGATIEAKTTQIVEQLEASLANAKRERQKPYLLRQSIVSLGTLGVMLMSSLLISFSQKRSRRSKEQVNPFNTPNTEPIETQLTQRQQWHVRSVLHLCLQLAQVGIIIGGSLFILSLFPYTRALQVLLLTIVRIPIRIAIVSLGTYILIRLAYALIARFNAILTSNRLLTREDDRRLQLRIGTISGVAKSIVTVILGVSGTLTALTVIGIDIAPLLAGVGILGFGLSLASQNLIKDAINGFFIIWEDQYAVGDVIDVSGVGGLVEKMNLRITQLRDAEGRLITIPNSEIKIVANLSSSWSRADLSIPVAYHTDVDRALELVRDVAQQMSAAPNWDAQIIESPTVLGVDNFESRGIIIRVWIKTQPLKQWDVSREFRRRIKIAFDKAGIPIPLPQQEVWFNHVTDGVGSR